MNPVRTAQVLRRLRTERGLSLRELAAHTYCDHSWLANIEGGRRWPKDRNWVERADIALNGGGVLVVAWDADQREYAKAADTVRLLEEAQRDSQLLLTAPDAVDLDEIFGGISDVAVNARFEPYEQTLSHTLAIRSELIRRLQAEAHRPADIRDLYVALGRVCGVLAYITLDLGQVETARVHAQAAFQLGDRADHDTLRAWSRGTQALAFRFTKDFEKARDAALDGLRYAGVGTGTTKPRLLCGMAASVANLGDSSRALELLDDAERARDVSGSDEIPGLFTFTPAKQTYYRGFSLMWAEDLTTLKKSAKASEEAIAAWQVQRSPGDEMLSQVYLATANARLGDLDASLAAVTPVLESPLTAHFSWVRKRLNQLNELIVERFPGSHVADEAHQTLRAYIHAA